MKICVTAQGDNLDAQVDPRFGRCQYFIIVDQETLEFEAIENSSAQAMGGAGIQSGQLISGKGVEVVLTGNVGPNAFQTLEAAGVKVITGMAGGSVKEAVEKFKKGELKTVDGPSVGSHAGMKLDK
ncbi:MAG: NifB/NifX family molybdenum-iron cluster-binding protein [Candidatus Omnitrophica bacterium]|nr:NifB/NifX family molybdenum-iron cluster-binding protein [Candidatus Omnitrophota bacterium]MCK4423373.1 NifB/NifX family molybdenum-iron cluster-binding protein [Candidatus Omnitrophota bacterium]